MQGKPHERNPRVRFGEGEFASAKPRRGSLLNTNTLLPMAFLTVVMVARAETFKWVDVDTNSAVWRVASNWIDESGQPAVVAPWNDASQTVLFGPHTNSLVWQTISLDARESTAGGWTWAEAAMPAISQTGAAAPRRTLEVTTSATTSVGEYGAWLTLQDILPTDLLWTFTHGEFGFRLPSTVDTTLALSHVSAAKRVDVSVPTTGTKATLESVHEGGPLVKRGAGELEVKATSGSDAFFHVAEGTLTLDGHAESDAGDDVPVPGAWMHLDADRIDTMKFYTGNDGRTYVTNWADVRGNGTYAYYDAAWQRQPSQTYLTDTTHAPFLNDTLVAGRSVMDFGRARATQDEALGPLACVLTFSQTQTDVREVFCSMGLTLRADGIELFDVPVFNGTGFPFLPTRSKIVADYYSQTHAAAFGDIMVDGVRTSNQTGWPKTFGVVSVGLTNSVSLSSLANDRMYLERVGGLRIGEILIFTNSLTHAQRLAVHRYLQRKWTLSGSLEDSDAGAVTLASNNTAISVPEGRTAQVGEVTAIGGTVVKTGAGELRVGSIAGKMGADKVSVDVRGGSVTFGGLEPSATDRPAEGAYLWLDANKASSFVYDDQDAATVSEWHDCRETQTTVFAQKPVGCYDYIAGGKLPVRVTNAKGSLCAVDFGDWSKSNETSAFMKLDTVYVNRIYDAFIVQACTVSGSTSGNVFGSSAGVALMKTSATALLPTSYGLYQGRSAYWTVNGAVTDPMAANAVSFDVGDYNVVSVSSPYKLFVDLLGAKDRLNQGSRWGGVRIGEFIIYDRRLTPAERRQTIAYLMKRWRGTVPAYAEDATARIGTLTFPATQAAEVETDGALAVESIEGSNGTLVKSGEGTLSVSESIFDGAPTAISVAAGRLEMSGGSPLVGIMAKTAFHFDASDLDSMTLTVTETSGGSVTNVTNISDQRVVGLSAYAWKNPTQTSPNPISFSDPTLQTVETAPGVFNTVLDFGDLNVHDGYTWADGSLRNPTNFNAAAMRFSTTFDNIREAHTLFADSSSDGRRNVTIFSDDNQYHYLRGNNGVLLSGNARTEVVRTGSLMVDCEDVEYTSTLPSGMHLVSTVPAGDTSIGAIGADRNCVAGGCQVGELLGFTSALTSSERAFLQAHLMAKWLGKPKPVWTNDVVTASVAEGATLAFGDSDVIRLGVLGGEGTVEAGTVLANGSLSLTPGKPLTISGAFVQEGSQTVDLGAMSRNIPTGEYLVLAATVYDRLNLTSWHIASELPVNRVFSFALKDGAVCLRVERLALKVVIR